MKLSIIVPCYNEVDNVSKLHDELLPIIEDMVIHGWKNAIEEVRSAEMIFVDDGSTDGTRSCIDGLRKQDPRISIVSFTRNAGQQNALRAGLRP